MKEYILQILQQAVGKDKAISKLELCRLTKLNERSVRNFIKELRMEGYIICSNSKGKGYYMASSREEIEHFVNEMQKRGRQCFAAASFASQKLKENENQITFL